MAIGVCNDSYPPHLLPGWKETSIALHTDDGGLFRSSENAVSTSQPFRRGDIVRCSIITVPTDVVECKQAEVTFSRNGEQITSAITDVPPGGFYGVIGMMSKNEKITLSPPIACMKKNFDEVWEKSTPELISHRENGVCMYTGSGDLSEESIGSIRGKQSIDPCGELSQRSFALRILKSGEKNYIAMGVVGKSYPVHLLPGWEDTSIGYHADGDIFQRNERSHSVSHPCNEGDVMQCTVQAVDNSPKQIKVTFYKNGTSVVHITAWTPQMGFYFCFGMMSKSEVVQVILPEITIPYNPGARLEFERVWDIMNQNIQHRGSGICHYVGSENVGTIRSKQPLDPFGIANSYEVKILDPGKNCYIALGVCSSRYSTDDLPGWDDLSVGFHADNGCILQSGVEENTRNPCHKGDVIRCMLEPVDGSDKQMNVMFQKNGQFIGKSIFWKPGDGKVFAQIGCMSEGEKIQIASPLQIVAHLKPDNTATPVVPVRTRSHHSEAAGTDSMRQEQTLFHRSTDGGRHPEEQTTQSYSHLFHPQNPSDEEEMRRILYQMHQHYFPSPHYRGPRLPSPGFMPPYGPPAAFPPRPIYRHPSPGIFSSISYPAPAHSASYSDLKLTSQQSEPVHRVYHNQSNTLSSTTSEVPPQLFSQWSLSSQQSGSSFDSLPEDEVFEGYMKERNKTDIKKSLHMPLSSSSPVLSKTVSMISQDASLASDSVDLHEELSLTPMNESRIGMSSDTSSTLSSSGEIKIQRSSSIIIEPVTVPKSENKLLKILHNVNLNADGSLEYAQLRETCPENAFVEFRLPLNEKLNYFEIELVEMTEDSNIAVGLVWDNYPINRLPGVLEGSVAFHTKNNILFAGKESKTLECVCVTGDIIGCRIALQFKSEIQHTHIDENHVVVEFFRNGLTLCIQEVFLPPNGFFPAIGITGLGTKVYANQNIQLTPESYFKTHPLPPNFLNFPMPPKVSVGWQCIRNSKMEGSSLFKINECCGKPAVVQHHSSFSTTFTYFQVKLQCEISSYSVLSIGAIPKLSSESNHIIPGESPDSMGFLPLLGFIMCKGRICSTIPEMITSGLYSKNTTIGVGVEFIEVASLSDSPRKKDSSLSVSKDTERVNVFFTVNEQQVNNVLTDLPKGGLYPTIAIEGDYNSSESLARVEFPKQFPCVCGLPRGFARGAENGFSVCHDSYLVQDKKGLDADTEAEIIPVRALQAALPLSPTRPYFEVRIHDGGKSFKISCGVASYNYPLNVHPGWKNDSIAFHADDGNLFYNGSYKTVTAAPCYNGAVLGCGARFPNDAVTTHAEVFFTVNQKIISSKLIKIPQMGIFPTVGMRTKGGMIAIDLKALDPFPDLIYNSSVGLIENIKMEGSTVQLVSSSNPGALQFLTSQGSTRSYYFTVTCLSGKNGRVMVGFSTNKACPLNFLKSQAFKACVIDVVSGKLMIYNQFFKARETCALEESDKFGIGIVPLPDSVKSLLFFTANDYVISYSEIEIEGEDIHPCILMIDSTTKLDVDMCSTWPRVTPIGSGWARHSNLKLEDSKITHSSTQTKKKFPIGFSQSSVPLTKSNPYFEVEIHSRASNRAIAIGLASRNHPSNQWIGWSPGSIGYHVDDGKLFKESNFGQTFGPKAYAGDVIGCGARLNHVCYADITGGRANTKIEVYFTINGALLNTQKISIPFGGLFPTLCLESPSEAVFFHRYKMFPPVANQVSIDEWANAYSVKQVGRIIKNCCRHNEINGGLPKAFCQARLPFSENQPYFQIDIISHNDPSKGHIQVGAAMKIPIGSITPNTHSILYSTSGHVITRQGSQKFTREITKCGLGDQLGCAIVFRDGVANEFDIYINQVKVHTSKIKAQWKEQELYPIIILHHPGDSVVPSLQMHIPVHNPSSLIGWLRSERVKVHNSTVEYIFDGKPKGNVGVAQISQVLTLDGLSYYEVEILDPGEKCTIAVGAASSDYPLNMQPGWCKNSIAYHGDDGKLFNQCSAGIPYASVWKKHDVIGLGIRSDVGDKSSSSESIQVCFTRNGVELGHFTVAVPPTGFFPTIGFHSPGERIKVSLGPPSKQPYNCNPLRLQWRALCGINLKKSSDCQLLTYNRNGRFLRSPGIVISGAIYGQCFSHSMQYYEIELLNIGSIGVAIGVATENYPLDQAPGWFRGSIAYHTDNGKLYNASVKGKEFGPVARCGDTIGCGISIPSNIKCCSVFFTYNGVEIGRVRAPFMVSDLYPAICLTDPSDKISVQFFETFKPKTSQSELSFVGLMRINHCSYSGQMVHFGGSGSGHCLTLGSAQFAVSLGNDRNYFATNIVECNDSILIGLAVKDYPLRYMPGTTSVSIAYDVMKGNIKAVYSSDNFYSITAPVCSAGDTIGCGIDFNSESKTEKPYFFFTVNNVFINKIDISDDVLSEDLYPIIGFVPHNKSSSVFMDWSCLTYDQQNNFK